MIGALQRLAGVIGIGTILALAAVPGASAAAFPTHRCGSFLAEDSTYEGVTSYNRITVLNKNVSCKRATAVIKAFWGPEDQVIEHAGGDYFTLRGFPGWRCTQGAGGGGCSHKHQEAAYTAKNA